MKIIQLKAENVLRLRAVEINPKGEVVKITGANGQGKTSVLDSIWLALDQTRVGAEMPVHKGTKKATIRLNLGEVTVERVITAKDSTLKITAADGSKVPSPQKFLDSLIGELSFDPLAFDRMKPREQYEELRKAVKVEIDFDLLTRQNAADFERRQEINRQAKMKRAQAEAMPITISDLTPIDESAILDRIQKSAEHNAELEQRKAKRAAVLQHAEANEGQAERHRKRIAALQEEIKQLEREAAECDAEATKARGRLAAAKPLPDPIDVSEARGELNRAREVNAALSRRGDRQRVEAEADELEKQAAALTDAMDARNAAKEAALAAVEMPVPGLGLGEGMVLFNGLPFSQASAAERLRVSMGIAMAANPKLRVIRISDGSLLDSRSMAIVGEMAKAADFQVWCEIVDESKKIGIVIEDGQVVAVNE